MKRRNILYFDYRMLSQFSKDYLQQDGVLILKLIGMNVNKIVVSELTAELYENWSMAHEEDSKHIINGSRGGSDV